LATIQTARVALAMVARRAPAVSVEWTMAEARRAMAVQVQRVINRQSSETPAVRRAPGARHTAAAQVQLAVNYQPMEQALAEVRLQVEVPVREVRRQHHARARSRRSATYGRIAQILFATLRFGQLLVATFPA